MRIVLRDYLDENVPGDVGLARCPSEESRFCDSLFYGYV